MKKNKNKIIFVIILITILVFPVIEVLEAKSFDTYEPISGESAKDLFGVSNRVPPLNEYLDFIFRNIVRISGILAVLVMLFGGIQYMTSDAWSNKSEGKEKIKRALIGLAIVLSSILLLNTINPDITDFSFVISQEKFKGVPFKVVNLESLEDYYYDLPPSVRDKYSRDEFYDLSDATKAEIMADSGVYNSKFAQQLASTKVNTEGLTASEAIHKTAQQAQAYGYSTCSIKGTKNGRVACAISTDSIVGVATGEPIGKTLSQKFSTTQMYKALSTDPRFTKINSLEDAKPGDIIISPTDQKQIGHVGIITHDNKIIANSSNRGKMEDHFTYEKWIKTYQQRKGLEVGIFRAN